MFGIYSHDVLVPNTALMRGFDERFNAPHSRHTEVRYDDVACIGALQIFATSQEAGMYLVASRDGRQVFVFGHPEYEIDTLDQEYWRDRDKGLTIEIPCNYYPENDPTRRPSASWFSHAQLLYTNWLNYHVYQTTPYDLSLLPEVPEGSDSPAAPPRR